MTIIPEQSIRFVIGVPSVWIFLPTWAMVPSSMRICRASRIGFVAFSVTTDAFSRRMAMRDSPQRRRVCRWFVQNYILILFFSVTSAAQRCNLRVFHQRGRVRRGDGTLACVERVDDSALIQLFDKSQIDEIFRFDGARLGVF